MNNIILILIPFVFFASCIRPKCYTGIFATKEFLTLDEKWRGKIISNKTIYSNENIALLNSTFQCSKKRTRTMKVLLDKNDSTMILVPHLSEFRYDSILYVNSMFFISPLESGLIVSNTVDGGSIHYEYPKNDSLNALTEDLRENGLYRYDNGEFKLVSQSLSQEAFKKHCSNDTCYIPYPGILYDRKVNLQELKSVKKLE